MGSIPDRVKSKTIKLVFGASQHSGVWAETGWLGIRMCLPADSLLCQCVSTIKIQLSMLVEYKADIIIISSNVTCSLYMYDIADWKIAHLTFKSNRSPTHLLSLILTGWDRFRNRLQISFRICLSNITTTKYRFKSTNETNMWSCDI